MKERSVILDRERFIGRCKVTNDDEQIQREYIGGVT